MDTASGKGGEQGKRFVVHGSTPCCGEIGANYSLLSGVRGGAARMLADFSSTRAEIKNFNKIDYY